MTYVANRTNGQYNIGGESYPSVTTILQAISKPALYYWHFQQGNRLTTEMKDKTFEEIWSEFNKRKTSTMDRGSSLHGIAEAWAKGRDYEHLFNEESGYHQAFVHFLFDNDHKIEPLVAERQIWHKKEGFAGTLDAIWKYEDTVFVVDYKTGLRLYPNEITLQLSAYKQGAMSLNLISDSAKLKGICFKADGTYEMKDFKEDFETFLAVKKLWEFLQENGKH